jgi:iron complex outermembrane receptor protein
MATTAIAGLAIAAPAAAQTRNFDVAAQPAAAGLQTLGRQADIQLISARRDTSGKHTNPVRGTMTAAQALDRLLAGTGLRARLTGPQTYAITPAAPAAVGGPDEEMAEAEAADPIVVTGSRIDRAGYKAPTPTLSLSADDLNIGGRANIAQALNDLPQFRATTTPQTTPANTSSGQARVDLRGLGYLRSLTLIDGRRFAGDVDLNAVPSVLIKRVEMVTGGVSAVWGSGAVAGVVNLVIDSKLEGVRLGAQKGISNFGDGPETSFEAAAGTSFAGGRGHVVVGGEFYDNSGIAPKSSRPRVGRWAVITNPAYTATNGQSPLILSPDVGAANASFGGLITSGVLRGQTFNPDGTLRPFVYGTVFGTLMIGGEGPSNDDSIGLTPPQHRYAAMGRVSYELTDSIRASADVRYSRMWADYDYLPDIYRGTISISVNNAFLPAAVKSQLVAAGQTSFSFGRVARDYAFLRLKYERETLQGTFALDGEFGKNWRWSAYYSHGIYDNNLSSPERTIPANFTAAVDSVISPTTGQPICRIALTTPTTDCAPLNLFGVGNASAAAIKYITTTNYSYQRQTLDVGAVSLRGEPFSLWAGPVSIAIGAEVRKERIGTELSALDTSVPLKGSVSVKEAFGEILIPLAKDLPLLRNLEVSAAARISDYSTSGSIWSWKVGLTNEIVEGVRIRASKSRDIRSPTLSELYTQQITGLGNIIDPVKGQTVFGSVTTGGNPNLKPEIGSTLTAGLQFSPRGLPGFNASIDYFDIKIDGLISTITPADILNRCVGGEQSFCDRVSRDSAGNLLGVRSNYINYTSFNTSGIDGEISYVLPLDTISSLPGRLKFRLFATWLNDYFVLNDTRKTNYLDSLGQASFSGMPRWRSTASISYDNDHFGGDFRARYVSSGDYDRNQNIQNNHIPATTYFDLSLRAKIPNKGAQEMEIYGNITNVFNKPPPKGSLYTAFYDVIGRYFNVGARLKF